jgi:Secretion system C-terminal sorting domain
MQLIYKTAGFLFMLFGSFTLHAQEGLYVPNGTSITNNTTITVLGNVTSVNGSTWINNGTIRINGDWIDQTAGSGYPYGTGQFIFTGTSTRLLNSPNFFSRIIVDGAGLELQSNIRANRWLLKNGIINTGTFIAIAEDASSVAIEADPSNSQYTLSWFNGTLRRFVTPSTVNKYIFPVGNVQQSNMAVLDNLEASPLTDVSFVDVTFGPKPGSDAGLMVSEDAGYVSVNNQGVWFINPDVSPATGKYDLLLYLNGFIGLSDNRFGILQRPLNSSNAANWQGPAGSIVPAADGPGRTVAGGFAQRNNIGTFGQVGIGVSTAPLPVTLVNFTALRTNKVTVQLDWQTASEQNNKGFEVERRYQDEIVFRTQGFVPSKAPSGNSSNLLTYIFTDPNNYTGISYYRIKQTDLDNHSTYTLIKAVKGTGDNAVTVLLWPNPNKGQFSIRVSGNNQSLQAFIINMNGSIVQRISIQQNNEVTVNGLVAGAYIIRIPNAFGNGEAFSEKVLVLK